jgi:hypothetical protein
VANTQAYYDTATITAVKSFIVQAPVVFRTHVTSPSYNLFKSELFLLVSQVEENFAQNYNRSAVIPPFCDIKQYYRGIYHRMAINYSSKMFYNIGPWW